MTKLSQRLCAQVSVTMIYLGYTANDTVPAWLNWWIAYVGSTDWYRAIRWYDSRPYTLVYLYLPLPTSKHGQGGADECLQW